MSPALELQRLRGLVAAAADALQAALDLDFDDDFLTAEDHAALALLTGEAERLADQEVASA